MPPMAWMGQETSLAIPPSPYALLVPGSAPQHPAKRWPVEHYIALAQRAVAHGIIPVALGTQAERPILDALKANVPQLIDLGGKTSFGDIAALARGAVAAVGNDTGPMHIIAVAGCPCVSLFSGTTNPAQSAPVGTVAVLRAEHIADIAVDAVWENFQTIRRVPATA